MHPASALALDWASPTGRTEANSPQASISSRRFSRKSLQPRAGALRARLSRRRNRKCFVEEKKSCVPTVSR